MYQREIDNLSSLQTSFLAILSILFLQNGLNRFILISDNQNKL